jgi:hypothetical protein
MANSGQEERPCNVACCVTLSLNMWFGEYIPTSQGCCKHR